MSGDEIDGIVVKVDDYALRVLAEAFGSLDALRAASAGQIAAIRGLGPEVATSVARFFAQEKNRRVLARIERAGVRVGKMPAPRRQLLRDKTFVLTGGLERYTRAEARERIEALGGRTTANVSREVDYLVVGKSPGAKLARARRLGVTRLDEDAFRSLIGED